MSAQIVCPQCGVTTSKPTSAINRARRIRAPIYCSRLCSGLGRRLGKTKAQKIAEKKAYDAQRRVDLAEEIRAAKAEYFRRSYDPKSAAVKRAERMPYHVEYCRQPEYKKKKRAYDRKYRAAEFGEFAEAYLLVLGINQEINERSTRYEIYQTNGTAAKTTRRKRAAARGSVALG